jgi:hypothetical protein
MSSFFPAQSGGSRPAKGDAGEAFDAALRAGRYLTDGVELYRSLGPIRRGPPELVGLENCRSLEVILIAADELCGDRLRDVTPASTRRGRAT